MPLKRYCNFSKGQHAAATPLQLQQKSCTPAKRLQCHITAMPHCCNTTKRAALRCNTTATSASELQCHAAKTLSKGLHTAAMPAKRLLQSQKKGCTMPAKRTARHWKTSETSTPLQYQCQRQQKALHAAATPEKELHHQQLLHSSCNSSQILACNTNTLQRQGTGNTSKMADHQGKGCNASKRTAMSATPAKGWLNNKRAAHHSAAMPTLQCLLRLAILACNTLATLAIQ